MQPAEKPELGFRLRELVHAIGVPLLVLVLVLVFLPVVVIGLLVYLVLLRWHERRDPAPHVKPPPELVQELAALEDHLVQNPFTAIGLVKPGIFRRADAARDSHGGSTTRPGTSSTTATSPA